MHAWLCAEQRYHSPTSTNGSCLPLSILQRAEILLQLDHVRVHDYASAIFGSTAEIFAFLGGANIIIAMFQTKNGVLPFA